MDSLTSGRALLLADPQLDIVNTSVQITFPTGSSTARAGLAFAATDNVNYWAVIINRSSGKIALSTHRQVGDLATADCTAPRMLDPHPHPVVREHLAGRLVTVHPETSRAGGASWTGQYRDSRR